MDIANGVKEYNLTEPITVYIKEKGGDAEVHLLTLHEPRREHIKYSSKMKQMITRACLEAAKANGETEPEALGKEEKPFHETTDKEHEDSANENAEMLNIALHISETVDLGEFIENFISMATKWKNKSIALCDDAVPIRDIHFDQMSEGTLTDLAVKYAAFFLMPSVMQSK